MKLKTNESNSPSHSRRSKGRKPKQLVQVVTGEDHEELQKLMTEHLDKCYQKPVGGGVVLTNEIGQKWTNPMWVEVDDVIRNLRPDNFNSFACLARRGNTYMQCMRGINGWHLEARITWKGSDAYTHLRACSPGGSERPCPLRKPDCVSMGEFRDLLKLEDVLAAFRAFHREKIGPPLIWRPIDV